jgi:hypothetical protein
LSALRAADRALLMSHRVFWTGDALVLSPK